MRQRFLPIAVIAIAIALGLALLGISPHRAPSGDEWRRTASGWERMDWRVPAVVLHQAATTVNSRHRFDSHPAVLALVQLVGTLLALYAFPIGASPFAAGGRNWVDFLTRSFRASAFGS